MALHPQKLRLARVSQEQAAHAFAVCASLDPMGIETPDSIASAGRCFKLAGDTGSGVFSVGIQESALWCYGAAGQGQGMTAAGLRTLEHMAKTAGCKSVKFQTMRRGLMRQAIAHGYRQICPAGRGYVFEKVI